jgi:enterobactin synthetase component D
MPLATRNPALFSSDVAQYTVTFEPDGEGDLALEFPDLTLPTSLARAVRKRRAEFLAGRHCAREALKICAPEYAAREIAIGHDRAPGWPSGVVGAITHTDRYASAAVARSANIRGIGLDAEICMPESTANDVLERIATREEITALERASGLEKRLALTLAFSVKESVFKCLYPEVGRYFDFHDAEVTGCEPASRNVAIRLVTTLTEALPAGFLLTGRYEITDRGLCTAVVLSR